MEQRIRTAGTVPFGYRLSEDLPGIMNPVESELEKLEEAFSYLDRQCPYASVSKWLYAKTGRYISDKGLKHRYKKERANKPGQAPQELEAQK